MANVTQNFPSNTLNSAQVTELLAKVRKVDHLEVGENLKAALLSLPAFSERSNTLEDNRIEWVPGNSITVVPKSNAKPRKTYRTVHLEHADYAELVKYRNLLQLSEDTEVDLKGAVGHAVRAQLAALQSKPEGFKIGEGTWHPSPAKLPDNSSVEYIKVKREMIDES